MNKMLTQTRIDFYSEKVTSCSRDQKNLFKITKHLLNGPTEIALPSGETPIKQAQEFSDFFIGKVEGIRKDISANVQTFAISTSTENNKLTETNKLTHFRPATNEEIEKLIKLSPVKSCEIDPIPTWLLKSCTTELLNNYENH
jgi:hypothetical protein